MYYPYLRGRQFELIALREFAESRGLSNNVVPIIEPVKKTFTGLKLALPILMQRGVRFAFILNPQAGEIHDSTAILQAFPNVFSNVGAWIPTYIVKNNYVAIEQLIAQFAYNDVMLICTELTDTSNTDFQRLVLSNGVRYVVCQENRSLKSLLNGTGKNLIRLDDKFNVQKRNIDYQVMPEEKFTEEHLFYAGEGLAGFSDYTCVSSKFVEGGSAPYAVALHLTFQKSNREIWIRHFTSTISATSQANIQAKFAEAALEALQFVDGIGLQTEAIEELRKYYDEARYPGLGMAKKISIKHHIELVNSIL